MKFILIAGLAMAGGQIYASEKTDKTWSQQLAAQALTAADQSYCYTNEAGEIEGKNTDMRVRLASTSKLLMTLWSVDKLGVDFKYDTKLFIKGNKLHIQGSFDPFLGNEKMFYLLSQLNEKGYSKFDTITFDKNAIIFPDVQYSIDEYPSISPATVKRHLKNYFNTDSWSSDTKSEYKNYHDLAKAGRFVDDIHFEVGDVQYSEANPFGNDSDVVVLTLSSPSLYKYVKQMNIKSNNYVADTLFRQLGGASKFEQYLKEKYNLSTDQIRFFTGSGLPSVIDGKRKDNYASCSIMLHLITELRKTVEAQKKEMEDIVAVPGSDGGTFRNRIFPADFKNSFVAKTGTLMHTSTLTGMMNTQKGISYFGVFNQSTDISGSKIVQNNMVKSIMSEMGGPKVFNYVVEGFRPYSNEAMKDFFMADDFSTVEGELY
jgi:D-alanyl-D-alanine carboxypeptidase/D-alanyl-D-alanine-endopeptidase (penicillin-binding protein 4)